MSRPYSTESVFRALADPTRRRVLDLLLKDERSVGDLLASFRLSGATMSHHLGILRATGLVRQRRRGRHRFYTLDARQLLEAIGWLDRYRRQAGGKAGRAAGYEELAAR